MQRHRCLFVGKKNSSCEVCGEVRSCSAARWTRRRCSGAAAAAIAEETVAAIAAGAAVDAARAWDPDEPQRTGGAHVLVGVLEVARGELDKAADALDGFGEERGDFAGGGVVDEVFDVVGVF
jgi:hypothetical protein